MTTATENTSQVTENQESELHALFKDTPLIVYADALTALGVTRELVSSITNENLSMAVYEEVRNIVKSTAHRFVLVAIAQRLREEAAAAAAAASAADASESDDDKSTATTAIVTPSPNSLTRGHKKKTATKKTKFDFLHDHVTGVPSMRDSSEELCSEITRHLKNHTGASHDLILFHLARTRSLSVYRTGASAENNVVDDATALRFRTVMRAWGCSRATVNEMLHHRDLYLHYVRNVLTHRNGERFRDMQKLLLADQDPTTRKAREDEVYAPIIAAMVADGNGKVAIFDPLTLHLRADWRAAMVNEIAPALGVDGETLLAVFTNTAMSVCDSIAAAMDHDGSYRATHEERFRKDVIAAEQKTDLFQHGKLRCDASDGECEILALKLYLNHCARPKSGSPRMKLANTVSDENYWWCFPLEAVDAYLKAPVAGSGPAKDSDRDAAADTEEPAGFAELAAQLAKSQSKKRAHDEMSDAQESPQRQALKLRTSENAAGGATPKKNSGVASKPTAVPGSTSTDGEGTSPAKLAKPTTRPLTSSVSRAPLATMNFTPSQ